MAVGHLSPVPHHHHHLTPPLVTCSPPPPSPDTTTCPDYDHLEAIAETILENGITEPNFRYTGARLCDYLSLHLTVILEGATLRQILMQKCNSLFKSRDTLVAENPERLRGFTIFLAELFQQLEIQVN